MKSNSIFKIRLIGALVTAGVALASPHAHAKPGAAGIGGSLFAVKVGGFVPSFLKAATADTGSAGIGNGPFPTLGIMKSLGSFELNLDATVIGRKGADSSYTARWFLLQIPYVWKMGVDLRFGPLIMMEMLSGSGGTIQLNNGSGTSTFSQPGATKLALLVGLTGGVRVPLGSTLSLFGDAALTGLLSNRRAVNILLALGVAL